MTKPDQPTQSDSLTNEMAEVTGNDSTTAEEQYQINYVLITDTGKDYYLLDEGMYAVSKMTGIKTDTMDRAFDPITNKIALSENSEDEMWRGDYYPRRMGEDFMSMEHLDYYTDSSDAKTIAVVAGIFPEKEKADSMLSAIKKHAPNAFLLKSNIYMGCMH